MALRALLRRRVFTADFGGIGVGKARSGGGTGLLKASAVLAAALIVVYIVAVWAMGGKPG